MTSLAEFTAITLISTNYSITMPKQEKLVDILLSLYYQNKELHKQLNILFAALEDDPKKMIGMLKREISNFKKSKKFFDYYESEALANSLDATRMRISCDLNDKSSEAAFELMSAFLDLHENILNRVDDSNGSVSYVFTKACADLGNIVQSVNFDFAKIVEIVFSRLLNNSYGIHDDIIKNFKIALNHQGFNLLRDKLQRAINKNNSFKIKNALKDISDCENDVDAFIDACSFGENLSAHDHLEIAKRLITHWRAKEALDWLGKIEIPDNHAWQEDRKRLKIEALNLDGRYEEAQNERLAWFSNNLNPHLYQDILNATKPDFKEAFKSESINKAFRFQDPHIAIHFLYAVQEFDEMVRFIKLRGNELSGMHYYTLRPIADLLQTIDPVAATHLYRKLIEPILEDAKSKYYNYAAKDLVKCGVLDGSISNWEGIQNHSDYFNEIEIKHKR